MPLEHAGILMKLVAANVESAIMVELNEAAYARFGLPTSATDMWKTPCGQPCGTLCRTCLQWVRNANPVSTINRSLDACWTPGWR
jgi:hypothetical protein